MMRKSTLLFWMIWMAGVWATGCTESDGDEEIGDAGADADSDADADADADSDADGDTDTDADGDADSDADTDADGDADSDADTDADSDADADADGDADTDADGDTDTDADGDTDTDIDTDTDSDTDTDTDADACPESCVATGACASAQGTFVPGYSCPAETPICCALGTDGDADTDTDTDTDTDADTDTDTESDSDTDTASACPASGAVTYTLEREATPTADQANAYALIEAAMDTAVYYYNCYTNIQKELYITYNPSVNTADGNTNGSIRFGKTQYMNHVTAMHEIGHTVGIGTDGSWSSMFNGVVWTGPIATAELREIDQDPSAEVHGDTQHFWPYGLNYESEGQTEHDLISHCLMVTALRQDMGL